MSVLPETKIFLLKVLFACFVVLPDGGGNYIQKLKTGKNLEGTGEKKGGGGKGGKINILILFPCL